MVRERRRLFGKDHAPTRSKDRIRPLPRPDLVQHGGESAKNSVAPTNRRFSGVPKVRVGAQAARLTSSAWVARRYDWAGSRRR